MIEAIIGTILILAVVVAVIENQWPTGYTMNPEAGQTWKMKVREKNPFREPEPFLVKIIAVKEGWVQYQFANGRIPQECPISEFKGMYEHDIQRN